VAHCAASSDLLYSGVAAGGTTREVDYGAYPDHLWALEAVGSSYHYATKLVDTWVTTGGGYALSGYPFSVRCVVALERHPQKGYGRLPCVLK